MKQTPKIRLLLETLLLLFLIILAPHTKEIQLNLENTNQQKNGPENGGTSGEAHPIDVIEEFEHCPPTNATGISEEQNKMFLLQEVARN